MRVEDAEVRLVCLVMVLWVAVPAAFLVHRPLAGAALVLVAIHVVRRLVRLACRPDPWAAFELALADLGVVVAADEPTGAAGGGRGAPPAGTTTRPHRP